MILDTNAVPLTPRDSRGIIGILAGLPRVALPVVVIGEYRYGVAQSRRKARYQRRLDGVIGDCIVLDVTDQTTHHYAVINVELRQMGKPIPTNDLWIAALCRKHGLGVLSRDRHFDAVAGIQRLDV